MILMFIDTNMPFTRLISICSIVLLMSVINGCIKSDPTICTEEFRTVGVEVTGKTLNKWFTVREKTGDTLR